MLNQLNMSGLDKVEVAIKRLRLFEPPEGYCLAFSGGKDSVVIKALADMAGVKYDAHYNVTSVDPPELIYFIRESHPDVEWEYPRDKNGERITMWNLIPRKRFPPTRNKRYCCDYLKERGGEGRIAVTGVRWAESVRRKNNRAGLEVPKNSKERELLDPDNPNDAEMARFCPTKGKRILNPIIDWSNGEVWEFIHKYDVHYCELYDQGHERLGCVGCPMSGSAREELEAYPKFKQAYLGAFEKMLDARRERGLKTTWETAQDVMEWWLDG